MVLVRARKLVQPPFLSLVKNQVLMDVFHLIYFKSFNENISFALLLLTSSLPHFLENKKRKCITRTLLSCGKELQMIGDGLPCIV